MQSKKIGFFGGTFDPIHFGHINLALYMLETQGLDEIFVCPARFSPHKEDELPVAKEHRREMVRLAIEPLSRFKLIDLELDRAGPSYTIDTLRMLKTLFKNYEFRLILGEDVLHGLSRWKDVEEVLSLAPPLVGARPSQVSILNSSIKNLISEGVVPAPIMEISSTDIRQRLKKGLFCGHLLPSKVLDYIYQNHVYYYH